MLRAAYKSYGLQGHKNSSVLILTRHCLFSGSTDAFSPDGWKILSKGLAPLIHLLSLNEFTDYGAVRNPAAAAAAAAEQGLEKEPDSSRKTRGMTGSGRGKGRGSAVELDLATVSASMAVGVLLPLVSTSLLRLKLRCVEVISDIIRSWWSSVD